MMSLMASVAGDTAPAGDAAAESVVPSRLCDNSGHKGMHPTFAHNTTERNTQLVASMFRFKLLISDGLVV